MCRPDLRVVLGLHRSRHDRRTLTAALDLGVNAIDTSFNYHGFHAHETLSEVAGDLLPCLTVSTKVGFFPTANGHAEHSLDPGRLLQAVTKTNTDLRRPPDLVLLHNPERSLVQAQQASDVLAAACGVLQEATTKGLCGSWGIASWNPTQLTGLTGPATPRPPVLMVRSGLMVGAETLEAAEALTTTWEPKGVWGMSPFGGDVENPVWDRVDPRIFLREPGEQCTRVQAAFRIAYNLPSVTAVAVGADDPAHLGELLAALPYDVDTETIQRYRAILRSRGRPQPA